MTRTRAVLLLFAVVGAAVAHQAAHPDEWYDLDHLQAMYRDPPPPYRDTLPTEKAHAQEHKEDLVVTLVRETRYGRPSDTPPVPTSLPSSQSANVTAPLPDAPHIISTLGRLKALRPVFTWTIHHPARALALAVPFLFRQLWHGLAWSAVALWTLLALTAPLFAPLRFLCHVLASPFRLAFRVSVALTPVWVTVASALALGALLGFAAAQVSSPETVRWVEEAIGPVLPARLSKRSRPAFLTFGSSSSSASSSSSSTTAAPRLGGGGGGARLEKLAGKQRMVVDSASSDYSWLDGPASSAWRDGGGGGGKKRKTAPLTRSESASTATALDADDDTDETVSKGSSSRRTRSSLDTGSSSRSGSSRRSAGRPYRKSSSPLASR